jgi:hypothetical protein
MDNQTPTPKGIPMSRTLYRYRFAKKAPPKDAEDTLGLAILAAEGLVGQARLRLDFRYAMDVDNRACVINATGVAGYIVACIFTSLLTHEFGIDAFTIERLDTCETPKCKECCA